MSRSPPHSAFGLYIHWPFCLSKCPYCDFNSHVRHQSIDEERFVQAFQVEIAHRAALTQDRIVHSIFLGGGTPSLMRPHSVAALLDTIAHHWQIDPQIEITLEANPTSVDAERFAGYKAAGVNRVSLGIQALNDADLKRLGRLHKVEESLAALEVARSLFDRFSFDIIYARPHQTPQEWQKELSQALSLAGGHLSLYQLTLEPGTPFTTWHQLGRLQVPDEETARILWDITQEETEKAHMPAYEISNHAHEGQESRHNLIYWRTHEYAGIGPGAHGRLQLAAGRYAQSTERHPETWLQHVETTGHGLIEDELLSQEAMADEFLLMGLRLREGICLDRYRALRPEGLPPARLSALLEDGLVTLSPPNRLCVTSKGFPLLDSVIKNLAR